MEANIQEGHTFIHVYEDGSYNIQYTKELGLSEICIEFKEYLLACGFDKRGIEEYINVE